MPCRYTIIMIKVFIVLALSSQSLMAHEWPSIIDASETVRIDDKKTEYSVKIFGTNGEALYSLDCHDFNYENDDYNYSGDFECRLSSKYNQGVYSNLLVYGESQTADWENRGVFYAAHFVTKCAEDKNWGRNRRFKLRGMTLSISVSNENIKNENGIVEFNAFTFSFSVKNSPMVTDFISVRDDPPEWFHKPNMCTNSNS